MGQQRLYERNARETREPEQDILDDIKARTEQNREETEQRRREHEVLDRASATTAADLDDLQSRIDERISENSEEFVIRFIQTEGQ